MHCNTTQARSGTGHSAQLKSPGGVQLSRISLANGADCRRAHCPVLVEALLRPTELRGGGGFCLQ